MKIKSSNKTAEYLIKKYGESPIRNRWAWDEFCNLHAKVYIKLGIGISINVGNGAISLPDAEDIIQDVMIRVEEKAHQFEGKYFRAYFKTIVRNASLDFLRKKKQEGIKIDAVRTIAEFQPISSLFDKVSVGKEEGIVDILIAKGLDTQDFIEEILTRLKPEQSECLRLLYFKRLSYKLIATRLDIRNKDVKTRINNGRVAFRREVIQFLRKNTEGHEHGFK